MLQINAVINAVNFRSGVGTTLAKQVATIIGLGRDKLRCRADFPEQIIIAEIFHEILSVRGDAERNSRDCFQEKGRVRCAVGEMNVKMIDATTREKLGEIEGIARSLLGLYLPAVFLLVPINKLDWPFASRFCIFFPDSENFLGWRVVNRCAQPRDMFVTQTRERRINRANLKIDANPFQRQHFRVTKRL